VIAIRKKPIYACETRDTACRSLFGRSEPNLFKLFSRNTSAARFLGRVTTPLSVNRPNSACGVTQDLFRDDGQPPATSNEPGWKDYLQIKKSWIIGTYAPIALTTSLREVTCDLLLRVSGPSLNKPRFAERWLPLMFSSHLRGYGAVRPKEPSFVAPTCASWTLDQMAYRFR
jgi:hypothetical protein